MKNGFLALAPAIISSAFLCCGKDGTTPEELLLLRKIEFNLAMFNEEGLYGPEDGLRAMSYEFCIPGDSALVQEVSSIDSTVKFSSSSGRSGCSQEQLLCIGHTHQPQFRSILIELASLPYVRRIRSSHFE